MSLLLTLGLFSACSNSDEVNTKSPDVSVSLNSIDEVDGNAAISDFFKTEFGDYDKEQKPFDFKNNLSNEETPCIIINNEEEFAESYIGSLSLPTIDFSKYTLLIGKVCLGAGTFIDNISIKQTNSATTTLLVNCTIDSKGTYVAVMYNEYYWKLFPKFNTSEINVEINKKIGEVNASKS